ncbi:hypothetical protein Tco_0730626 [Tanacetum coccineum]|uniref:Uncharacterized protein n=1 Tax=Tanacetum coccineum TaxID=301880 RepID=A0ABQ4YSN6_9ASTR
MNRDHSDQLQADLAEARKKHRNRSDSPRTPFGSPPLQPPSPPPPAGASGALDNGAPSSSKAAASTLQSMAWTTFDTRYESAGFAATQETSPTYYLMNDDYIPDEQWKLLPEEERPATLEPAWTIPSSNVSDVENNWASVKGCIQALSISKMKVAHYYNFGLELLVPEHMWIDDICTYDISASFGIFHWWFNHQKFYIDQHTGDSSRKVVRTHMRILNVVRIKSYSRYGYDYLKEITLCRADHQEYTIAEKDFKHLYLSDFEDLNLLLLQSHLNHLPGSDIHMLSTAIKLWTRNLVIRQQVEDFQLGIESYQKQLNLTKPGWDENGFEYKHNYTLIDSPRAVVFPVSNNERKITRFNEIYKFSDGTLTNIMEALDYKVKEYKVNRLNPEGSCGIWNTLLVDCVRGFIGLTELLQSDTYTGNPVKEILLKLNLPDHRFKYRWR